MKISIITGSGRALCNYLIERIAQNFKIASLVLEIQDISFSKFPLVSRYVQDLDIFFQHFTQNQLAYKNTNYPIFETQNINLNEAINFIKNSKPDLILTFGISILNKRVLSFLEIPILNLHTGLTPYYRGSLSGFWCIHDNKIECLGSTIHYITEIVDGGGIIQQRRPRITESDNIHDLLCKNFILGVNMFIDSLFLIYSSDFPKGTIPDLSQGCFKKSSDFNPDALSKAILNISNGIVSQYLLHKDARDAYYPIVQFPNENHYQS